MDISVINEEGLDIVSGRIEGDLTKSVAADYFTKVSKIALERDCSRVLTDLRSARLMAGEEDMESLSKELPEIGMEKSCKRAILISTDIKEYKAWENYCFRNGFHKVKLFLDHEIAIHWLSQN